MVSSHRIGAKMPREVLRCRRAGSLQRNGSRQSSMQCPGQHPRHLLPRHCANIARTQAASAKVREHGLHRAGHQRHSAADEGPPSRSHLHASAVFGRDAAQQREQWREQRVHQFTSGQCATAMQGSPPTVQIDWKDIMRRGALLQHRLAHPRREVLASPQRRNRCGDVEDPAAQSTSERAACGGTPVLRCRTAWIDRACDNCAARGQLN